MDVTGDLAASGRGMVPQRKAVEDLRVTKPAPARGVGPEH